MISCWEWDNGLYELYEKKSERKQIKDVKVLEILLCFQDYSLYHVVTINCREVWTIFIDLFYLF